MSSWRLDGGNFELRRLGTTDVPLVIDLARRAFQSDEIADKVDQMLRLYVSSGAHLLNLAQQTSMMPVSYYVMTAPGAALETILGLTGLYYPLWAGKGVFWLGWFAVDPRVRGQGHGARLLRATMEVAAARGGRLLCIETSDDLDGAIRLYSRLGFTRSGEIAHYWAPGSNLIIFTRSLDDLFIPQEIPDDL